MDPESSNEGWAETWARMPGPSEPGLWKCFLNY